MADPTSMPPQATEPGFGGRFLPGLVIGLVVGGLAGAILPSVLERVGMGSGPKLTTGASTAMHPAGPRDARPGDAVVETPKTTPLTPVMSAEPAVKPDAATPESPTTPPGTKPVEPTPAPQAVPPVPR